MIYFLENSFITGLPPEDSIHMIHDAFDDVNIALELFFDDVLCTDVSYKVIKSKRSSDEVELQNKKKKKLEDGTTEENLDVAALPSTSRDEIKSNASLFRDVTQFIRNMQFKYLGSLFIETALLKLKFPRKFDTGRVEWRRILLYGPPGSGKTYLIKKLAEVSKKPLVSLKSSCQNLKEVLIGIEKNAILLIDEVDGYARKRSSNDSLAEREKVTDFLKLLEECIPDNTIFFATNHPQDLDEAFLKRCQKKLYVRLPNHECRVQFFKRAFENVANTLSEVDFIEISHSTTDYSYSEMSTVIDEARLLYLRDICSSTKFYIKDGVMKPLTGNEARKIYEREWYTLGDSEIDDPPITKADIMKAISMTKKLFTQEQSLIYESFTHHFGNFA